MGVIATGAHPLALSGGMGSVTDQSSPNTPLYPSTLDKLDKKPKKPPKIKKPAFGATQAGAAFRK